MLSEDEKWMKAALKEAEKAFRLDEVPIGCVIVMDGRIIARGHNVREKKNDPTGHAEMVAIRKACRKTGSWRLPNAGIYVTVEPCAMCAGAIILSRIRRVVYGAPNPKGGALGTSFNLFDLPGLNHRPEITKGVLERECSNLMKKFFASKRNSGN